MLQGTFFSVTDFSHTRYRVSPNGSELTVSRFFMRGLLQWGYSCLACDHFLNIA
jgi:hypothetical protein